MRRGTTPTLKIKVNGANIQQFSKIYVTFRQGETEVTKTNEEIDIKENVLSIWMSQEDTLKFVHGHVDVQLRAVTESGVAVASGIKMLFMDEILKEGVIES